MQIALIQQAVSAGNKQKNYDRITQLVEQALTRSPKPDLLILPELWSTGYALADLARIASDEGGEEAEFLGKLARKNGVWFAGGSVAAKTKDGITNRAQIIDRNGLLQGIYDKVHLVPMLNEHKYLTAGSNLCIHEIEGVKFGFAICYDIRFCEFIRKLALNGAQAIIVAAEWPLVRLSHWRALLKARAIENQCYVLAANNVATGDAPFAGHSVAHGPDGSTLCQFEFQEGVNQVCIETQAVEAIRTAVPVFKDRRPELY
ncbi:carbon-nitrogen family hydrolase [Desulforhopalus sp. IMCC35007]|uniref:carbon-nitrogen family hydrolase n=1 Tax=Desulforhopalus sp. IMCC35007 TaxID=2569543 RepID=UPI0010ADFFFA|nr:carbon-nitrogen family hydrolase [Desulforhopalus sp. IMCC35007]TKB08826.1 carbon-nitrogen family hydrolase [Desulforhopalus sp. IMCC35007]